MVRFKNRYLLIEVCPVDEKKGMVEYRPGWCREFASNSIAALIRTSITSNFGQVGASLTGQSLSVKYANASTGMVLVRTARELLHMVWVSVSLLTGVPMREGRCIWRVVHVAGTIRSAQKNAMKMNVGKLREIAARLPVGEQPKYEEMIKKCTLAIRAIDA